MIRALTWIAALFALAACLSPKRTLLTDADPGAPPDVAKPPDDAEFTDDGIASRVLRPGNGTDHPGPLDYVTVQYTGWTTDGIKFDSSYDRERPDTFSLGAVIPGWSEALQLMVVGEKRRMWIPQPLAYRGKRGKPAGTLVFDVELLGIVKAQPPPAE